MSKTSTKQDNNLGSCASKSEVTPSTSQVECNSNNLQVVQIGKVSYHSFLINIFTDSTQKNPRRFFYEPIVLLDLKSISSQTNQLFKQDVVHFTLKMWNTELRSKVLERVQSMPTFKELQIDEEDICVMPYEEVQLVLKPGSNMDQSVQLMEQPTMSFHSFIRVIVWISTLSAIHVQLPIIWRKTFGSTRDSCCRNGSWP